jgi:hypothetical protein
MTGQKEVTRWERELFFYTRGTAGGFYTKLVDAFMHADGGNTARLLQAFPDELTPVHKYRSEEGYWEDLQERIKSGS